MPAAMTAEALLNLFAQIREALVPFEKHKLVARCGGKGK